MSDLVSTLDAPRLAATDRDRDRWIGRCIVNPWVDYALVGGAITLPIFAAIYFFPWLTPSPGLITTRSFLLINGVHFAASTLRLYTMPGARRELPFLSWGFPVVCLIAVALGVAWPAVGRNLTALYFTWSPYHYAAQAYGLAVMYSMRSGARLDLRDKTAMWWVCLLPFMYSFMTSPEGGLSWFVPRDWPSTVPLLALLHKAVVRTITGAIFLLPVLLFWQLRQMRGKNIPLIALVLPVTNGIWWLGTDYLDAWFWAALLHSVQYLIVVVDRHVADQMARTDRSGPLHRPAVYAAGFYGISFVLAVVLFFVVPLGYIGAGLNGTDAFAMMVMVINLHHFIVDGFIWRANRTGRRPLLPGRQDSAPIAASA